MDDTAKQVTLFDDTGTGMAKDKERTLNPAAQQRKLDKAKALRKSKADVQARRNERLAHRNPDRLQRQIDDLKALETSGDIKSRERQILADLEREVKAIRKAREALGDKAPQFPQRGRREDGQQLTKSNHNILGKRTHGGQRRPDHRPLSHAGEEESDTDDSVRNIPMPRDTPPPIPRPSSHRHTSRPSDNANVTTQPAGTLALPAAKPQVQAQTTYSSAPQLRDLKREAISRFVPDVVRRKQQAIHGAGGLLEPEELDRLEAQGYGRTTTTTTSTTTETGVRNPSESPTSKKIDDDDDETERRRLAEEERRFQQELEMELKMDVDDDDGGKSSVNPNPSPQRRRVEIEEVEDEDG